MKKTKFQLLFAILMMSVISVSFTSCGDDNDNPILPEPETKEYIYLDNIKGFYRYVENGKIILLCLKKGSYHAFNKDYDGMYTFIEYSVSSNNSYNFNGYYHGGILYDGSEHQINFGAPTYYNPDRNVNNGVHASDENSITHHPQIFGAFDFSSYDSGITFKANGNYYSFTKNKDFTTEQSHVVDRQYVDLGLNVNWAKCNIGATHAEDYGIYTGWGDPNGTMTSTSYSDYPYQSSIIGTNKDAATVQWGTPWRMPTLQELEELNYGCVSDNINYNGIKGEKFLGPSGETMFLPSCGHREGNTIINVGGDTFYWSGEQYNYNEFNPSAPKQLAWGSFSGSLGGWYNEKWRGCSVRAVQNK